MAGQPSRAGARRLTSPRILPGRIAIPALTLLAACTPCAAVREDLARALRQEAALVGVGARADAGWRPHASLTISHDLLQRLVGVLDSGAALPELRVEGGAAGDDAWVLRSTPRLASLVIAADETGAPVLRMRFVGGDDSSLRLRRLPTAAAAFTEAAAVVPVVLGAEGARADADFGRAVVVDPVVLAELTGAGSTVDPAVVDAWRAELERVLRFDVGTVELLRLDAPIGLGVRLVGLRPGARDSLEATFVTTLRPARALELPAPVDVPGTALRLHPGLAEAWLRERTADSLARRTLDADGALDASAATVLTVDRVDLVGDRVAIDATLRCTARPRCETLDAPATGEVTFGRDGARVSLQGTQRAVGWRSLASEELAALLNGFAITLPDQAPIRLLPRTVDTNGGYLMRAATSDGPAGPGTP